MEGDHTLSENATMFNMSQDSASVVAAAESLTDGK
jgi:hypothetical protein